MSYSALRKDKNFSCRKLAKALSEKFPVINAQAISYAERPRDSGITYTMEARRYIDDLCNPATKRRKEQRKCTEHLSVWLPEGFRELLNTLKTARGFNTVHDYIIFLINKDKKFIEKVACSAATETSDDKKGGFTKNIPKDEEDVK